MKINNLTRTILTGAAAWMACSIAGAAESPPTTPFLRIEAGMHTGIIEAIDTDASGRYAVTVSDDKTARVWDVASGRALTVLRPPIGMAAVGKLYTVAISPDGETVLVGGMEGKGLGVKIPDTSPEYPFSMKLGAKIPVISPVYVFSRSSGQMLRRLADFLGNVSQMAFSPDGRWLALGSNRGLQVIDWRTPEKSAVRELSDMGPKTSIGAFSWSADNRIAAIVNSNESLATQTPNEIRIYQVGSGKLTQLLRVPCASIPYSNPGDIAFSPDGRFLALALMYSQIVGVFDAHTLQKLFELSATGAAQGGFARVAWSGDGRSLYAAGDAQKDGKYFVRVWPKLNQGVSIDVVARGGRMYGLRTLPGRQGSGAGVLVGGEADWGVVDASSQWRARLAPLIDLLPTPDNKIIALPLSQDGREIQFRFRGNDRSADIFSVSTRQLRPLGPRTQLDQPGYLSVDTPGGDRVWANYGGLVKDANRADMWIQFEPPSYVTTINVPSSGKFVVAGYADGTIRWHRLSDGKELLAFFAHADGRRWVLWTPSGYYDASPGGEELIGWHVNRGDDQAADFFPAAKFRNRFYRPDVIDRVLDTLDESQAVLAANAARGNSATTPANVVQILPAVVELISANEVSASQTQLSIRYRTRSTPDAPVTRVFARVNGLIQSTARRIDVVGADDSQEMVVQLPPEDSEVQLFAENRHGASVAAIVHVKWTGAASPAAAVARTPDSAGFQIQPKLYLLAIGVSAYQSKDIPKLAFAAKDAQDFVQAMQRQQGRLYKSVEVKILADDKATKDEILDDLEWLQKQVTQHDVGMLFLSGHGANDASLGFVYLPVDADLGKLKRTGVTMADFKTTLSSITGKAVAFLDTCHSGNIFGSGQKGLNDMSGVINELASAENGLVVFSSSTGRQFSLENASWNNGAFTKALVEGVDGKADEQHSGRVTYKMLDLYVSERVKSLTQGNQSPVTQAPGGVNDFPLALTQ
jgi:WD40 repeat protein